MYIHTYTHTHTHEGLCTYFNYFTVITFSATDTPETMTRVPDLLTLLTLRALFLCGNFLFFFFSVSVESAQRDHPQTQRLVLAPAASKARKAS